MPPEPLHYRLDLTRPGHEIAVTATFPRHVHGEGILRVYMPRWAPGSYLLREFARHVDWIRAEQDGQPVDVPKTSADEWSVSLRGDAPVVIAYGLHAHELTVRTNYLASDRALLSGAATYLLPVGPTDVPARVDVVVPEGWPAPECSLEAAPDGGFVAPDIDTLLDAPIAAGPCRTAEFDVRGVPHRIALYGQGDCDLDTLAADVEASCEAAAEIFRDIPCSRYLFIIELGCSGGLEHGGSSVCGFPVVGFATQADRRRHLSLAAHEYFHLWNVKRIRPRALGPFDYRREAHTPHLWVAEGLTSYYQHLIGLRAGLLSPERLLTIYASYVLELESTPGRELQSLEESSHDAWIKFYRPHANSTNSTVSYYGKGTVAGLVLDLEIRRRSGGEQSLDDAFRTLWAAWRERPGEGFSDEELRDALSRAAGEDMGAVVDTCARSRGHLDVDAPLLLAGLELHRRKPAEGAWLGILPRRSEGRLLVDRIVRDGPAWAAGLAPGEEILALDGYRVDEPDLRSLLEERRPGQRATLTTAAWGRLREVSVRLAARASTDYRIRKAHVADDTARKVVKAWLGKSWEDLRPLDEPPEDQRSARGPRTA